MTNFLNKYVAGISRLEEERQKLREKFNAELGSPTFFVPFLNDPRFGVGWFKRSDCFEGYTKYANGYDPVTRIVVPFDFVRTLASQLPEWAELIQFLTNLLERCEHGGINENTEDRDWHWIYVTGRELLRKAQNGGS